MARDALRSSPTKAGPVNNHTPADKAELRKEFRGKLKVIPDAERVARSAELRDRLARQAVWHAAESILFFVPVADEPDVWPLFLEALGQGRTIALPRFSSESGVYESCRVGRIADDLRPGRFGILEPAPHCPVFPVKRLDLALVPGLGFSLAGGRLGRGKGYYDRLLAGVSGLKCGVAFDCQIAADLPMEPHDVRLNCILTPKRWHMVLPPAPVLK